MKILIIGDPHGTTLWKDHLNNLKNDIQQIYVIGDYFDNWKNNWSEIDQIKNVQEMIDYKYKDARIHLCIGNHDLAYLTGEIISGKQTNKEIDIREFLFKNLNEFEVAFRCGDWIISHAGFSGFWARKYGYTDINQVNESFHCKNYEPFRFQRGTEDSYGNSPLQGPLWIRPEALKNCMWYDKQIVGHTATDHIKSHYIFTGPTDNKQELYIVDKNDHSGLLELEV